MRHYISLFTICLVFLASCAPENDFKVSDRLPVIGPADYERIAQKWEFDNDTLAFSSFEITESGMYLLSGRGDDERVPDVLYGKVDCYVDTLFLGGDGYVLLDGDGWPHSLCVHSNDGDKSSDIYSVSMVEQPLQASLTTMLCRSWTPKNTLIFARRGNGPKVGDAFGGCDLGEILDAVVKKGINLKKFKSGEYGGLLKKAIEIQQNYDNKVSSMVVSEITFTKQGTFIVGFQDIDPYVGRWEWLDEGKSIFAFDFIMPGDDDEPVLISSTGQVAFNDGGECDLTIDATFTSDDTPYTAWVDLICVHN